MTPANSAVHVENYEHVVMGRHLSMIQRGARHH